METEINELEVNGVEYIHKDLNRTAESFADKPYVIVRTYSAGVFAGYLSKREGKEATILEARRIHYWDGAASLSQMAMEGVSKPQNCRFAMAVTKIEVTEVIEILQTTERARTNILKVPIWKV